MGVNSMNYQINGIIISKKPHACTGNQWEIVRIGADVKLKCTTCGRFLFVDYDKLNKMVKKYIEPKE